MKYLDLSRPLGHYSEMVKPLVTIRPLLGALGMFLSLGCLIQTCLISKEVFSESQSITNLAMSSEVIPSVGLDITGGVNARGRRTLLTGSAISFGNVLYAQPDLISNGDAYLDNNLSLQVEATLSVQVLFGGVNRVDLSISQLPAASNGFSNLLYSVGNRREDPTTKVAQQPDKTLIKGFTAAEQAFPLRVIGVILPTQGGIVSSTFQIDAQVVQ